MIMKANKQIGFIYKDNESIDRILKDGDVVFERGFLRERTTTTLPITFGGVGKDLKDYKIYGNTYQNSTRGINLYNYKSSDLDNNIDNLTVSLDKDSYLIINGTNNKSYRTPIKDIDITDLLEDGQTYTIYQEDITLSDITNNFSKVEVRVARTKLNGTIEYPRTNGKHTARITVDKTNYTKYGINVVLPQAGDTYSNYKNRFMLLKGSYNDDNVPSFEPYTGGQPSPNPDYPQEIISCGDKTSNLFSSKMESGTINDSGQNANSENAIRTKDYIKVKPNTTYTMSNDKNYRIFLYQYDENNDYVTHSNNYGGYITFTTTSNTKYVKARTNAGTIENDLTSLWKLEKGDTATSYEPYGYKIPVNVRSDNLAYNFRKIWYSTNSGLFYTANNFKSCMAKVKPNTEYTISKKNASNRFVVITNKNEIVPSVAYKRIIIVEQNSNRTQYTFTTQADENYLFFGYYSGTDETEIELAEEEIMIVEGSTAPSKYIPYYNETTNIYLDEPLRKIGEYSDYIDFKNGKVVRNIEEYTLIGDEQIKMIREGMNCVKIDGKNIRTETNTMPPIFCNMLLANSRNSIYQGNVGIGYGAINNEYYNDIVMRVPNITTLTDFTTWLQSNNVIVDYVLATPTQESITLPNIPTLDGNNTLNIKTEITPSQVYIKYKSNT